MPLVLQLRSHASLPIDGRAIRPDHPELGPGTEVGVGNSTVSLGELFQVEGSPDGHLRLEGDLSHVHGLASGMASGVMEVDGNVGDRLAVGMSGGTVEVRGDAGDWAGADLLGGRIRVKGNAGRWLGAALPGSRRGMREGAILVDGSVGDEAGLLMRRGLIAVGGRVGERAGRSMIAGSLFGFGGLGRHAGTGMKRGSLVAFGLGPDEILPTFNPAGRFRPHVLTIYLRQLAAWGFAVPEAAFLATPLRYNGDLAAGGQGELLVAG